jgi:glycosyltransferase involved in cell wall biosynthesis
MFDRFVFLSETEALLSTLGALRPDLEALAARLGIASRVRFLGLRHDVPALLGGVDVLALTSLYEGLPNVVIEAMATGAVAVATDVGGCHELIVPGEPGFLVPPGDVEAVASAMLGAAIAGRGAWHGVGARRRVESEAHGRGDGREDDGVLRHLPVADGWQAAARWRAA